MDKESTIYNTLAPSSERCCDRLRYNLKRYAQDAIHALIGKHKLGLVRARQKARVIHVKKVIRLKKPCKNKYKNKMIELKLNLI